MSIILRVAAEQGVDRSDHPNVVEYAVQSMFKGKTLENAAKGVAKKHSGHENMFFGPGVTKIDPKKVEDALWDRLVDYTVKGMSKIKEGKEHFALDGTIDHFKQKPTARTELKKRVVKKLHRDPFQNDDR